MKEVIASESEKSKRKQQQSLAYLCEFYPHLAPRFNSKSYNNWLHCAVGAPPLRDPRNRSVHMRTYSSIPNQPPPRRWNKGRTNGTKQYWAHSTSATHLIWVCIVKVSVCISWSGFHPFVRPVERSHSAFISRCSRILSSLAVMVWSQFKPRLVVLSSRYRHLLHTIYSPTPSSDPSPFATSFSPTNHPQISLRCPYLRLHITHRVSLSMEESTSGIFGGIGCCCFLHTHLSPSPFPLSTLAKRDNRTGMITGFVFILTSPN